MVQMISKCGLLVLSVLILCRTAFCEVDFNQEIRPILVENCLHCHGPDEQNREAELRLDLEQSAKLSAIVAGKPTESELVNRVETHDPDLIMPPVDSKKKLTAREISLIRQWVAEGAKYQGHWAFEPIIKPQLPEVSTGSELKPTEIDLFILKKLEAQDLQLRPQLSKQQLIRRATFDLIGLPPTWEEVQSFVNDQSPQAFANVIDRLLASPRYGEKWGRHWLDIARYADTHGGSAIGFTKFPFSYTYRDYVINAFNEDLPFQRFVQEQLAADQLKLSNNDPALAGLGFLTVGMQFRSRHDVIDDQIDVTSRGLLGLTVACARCHDHKYDPIPTADYYALYATFASSRPPELPPIIGSPPETQPYQDYAIELQKRQIIHEDLARDQTDVMRSRLKLQVGMYLRELAKGTPEQDLSASFLSYRTDDIRPLVLNRWREYLAKTPTDDPVFGPWVTFKDLAADTFETASRELLEKWKSANGDPASYASQNSIATATPPWNPKVIEALSASPLKSMTDVADAYGTLFADVHKEWLKHLLEISLEAGSEGVVVPDEDGRHTISNSAILRQLRRHLYEPGSPTAMDRETAITLLNRTVRDALGGKQGAIDALQLSSPGSPPRAMTLAEDENPQPFHVFNRGNPIDRGELVEAHFLQALTPENNLPDSFPAGEKRLALANSIVAPENPLFRRVVVNWAWRHHFGSGLVRTPDDFGTRSQPPTHPELLDFLAVNFLEDGWSLKKLHKRIMLSSVYQQGAIEDVDNRNKDPQNKLLWRMPRQRLEMEVMRDALLAVSGELNVENRGGRPFDFLSNPTIPKRSVYGFINRDIIHSLASTFDGANPTACTAKRPQTTVPQQTLFALNSNFIQDRAVEFAKQSAGIADQSERIVAMYRRALSREPDQHELEAAVQYLSEPGEPDAWNQLAHIILAANEFVFID